MGGREFEAAPSTPPPTQPFPTKLLSWAALKGQEVWKQEVRAPNVSSQGIPSSAICAPLPFTLSPDSAPASRRDGSNAPTCNISRAGCRQANKQTSKQTTATAASPSKAAHQRVCGTLLCAALATAVNLWLYISAAGALTRWAVSPVESRSSTAPARVGGAQLRPWPAEPTLQPLHASTPHQLLAVLADCTACHFVCLWPPPPSDPAAPPHLPAPAPAPAAAAPACPAAAGCRP